MKILFVLANYFPYVGGSELLFQRLAEGLVERGYHVKVITSRMGLVKNEVINGVEVERIDLPIWDNPFLFTFMSIPTVIKQAKNYDIIQTSSNYSALSAFIGSLIRNKKIVITCHEVLGKRWEQVLASKIKAAIFRLIEKLIVSLPYDRYICISQATQADLISTGVTAEKTSVIYPGVELEGELVGTGNNNQVGVLLPEAKFIYAYFGRPGLTKGVNYLVDAVPEISREIPGSHLVMVLSTSPAQEFEKIKTKIAGKGLQGQITLLPSFALRNELFTYLRQTDCIVIPSLTEGFGFTTVESSSLDVPVVASIAGSIPEVVFGEHVLVEKGSAKEIAVGVVRVYNGDTNYLEPKDFNWDTMIDEYNLCYLSITNV